MRSIKKIDELFNAYMVSQGIERDAFILVAYSGGPDSTALLSLLSEYTADRQNIIAAWYNHRLRDDSEMDAEMSLVEKTTTGLGIRLEKGAASSGEIKAKAAFKGSGIEEAARECRYKFLNECSAAFNAEYIATGHNLNDNAETMIMRYFSNSGLFGLSGIPLRNGNIIRPLSSVPRGLIEEYLDESGIAYSIDSTNTGGDFLRNRVRNELMPVIKKIFPDAESSLNALSRKFSLNNDFIRQEAEKQLLWIENKGGFSVSADNFYSAPPIVRIYSIFNIINRLGISDRLRYDAIEKAVTLSFPGNGKYLLKTGTFSLKAEDSHIYVRSLVNHNKKSYLLYLEPEQSFSIFGQTISVQDAVYVDSDGTETVNDSMILSYRGPLIARSYRESDKIKTSEGYKSLKKIFNEWRVFSDDRDLIPVIEAEDGILAVVGEHFGYKNKISTDAGRYRADKTIMLKFGIDTETTGE